MIKIKKFLHILTGTAIAFTVNSSPIEALNKQYGEWHPKDVVDKVYEGIQYIHDYQRTPDLIWNVSDGSRGGCGTVRGSHYCSRNHTIYITENHIRMAYEHGDAALAYIVSHEYAHAMQVAYGFMPSRGFIAELQADCLSGAYFALIPNIEFDAKDIFEASTLAYRIGDFEIHSADHHGTPEQRREAISFGINSGLRGNGIEACINYYR